MNQLNSGTLVLSRSWMAVQICSVKRAISLLYQGHAKVIGEDYLAYDFNDWSEISQLMIEYPINEFIHSPSLKIKIPRVIVLMLYDKLPKKQVRFSRKNIFERDNYTCQYCGTKPSDKASSLTFDHVIPRSQGGKTTWSNIATCCHSCNRKKSNKTPRQLGWRIKKKPTQPRWHPTLNIPLKVIPHKEWRNFLDVAYWNVELENDNTDSV